MSRGRTKWLLTYLQRTGHCGSDPHHMVRGVPNGECRRRQDGAWGLVPNGVCGQSPTVLNPLRGKLPKNFGITCYTILNYGSSATILEGNFNMGWG